MIVMKFGGAALASSQNFLKTSKIIKTYSKSEKVICVVSATKGTTDTLYQIADLVKNKKRKEALEQVDNLYKLHIQILNDITSSIEKISTKRELKNLFTLLAVFIKQISPFRLTRARLDYIAAFGERASCKLMVEVLKQVGVKAIVIDAADFLATTENFGHAVPLTEKSRSKLDTTIKLLVKKDIIPVITGFIGFAKDGCTTTLGRGGSDLSAAVIANILNAKKLILWKDVDGLYSKDPKRFTTAKFIKETTYEEAEKLAKEGARVIYFPSLKPVRAKNIPVVIKNFNQPQKIGTKIQSTKIITYSLLQLGIGNVGQQLIKIIVSNKKRFLEKRALELKYLGIFNSQGGIFKLNGLSKNLLEQVSKKGLNHKDYKSVNEIFNLLPKEAIIIDVTNSEKITPFLIKALRKGFFVVSANKKPFSGRQKDFDDLYKYENRLKHETTVGAGLPVISTLKNLINSGDKIIEIKGCFSGTIGFILSHLEQSRRFSQAVNLAYKNGYTEPDPREDLSGIDVSRKLLILARIMGAKNGFKERLSQIKTEKLYPEKLSKMAVADFLRKITIVDNQYKERSQKAKKSNQVIRYIAKIKGNRCSVALETTDKNNDLGNLKGPENIIVFKTKRYYNNPLTIKGPGAGRGVTAAGLLTDILSVKI